MTAVAVQQPGANHQTYSPRQSPHSSNMSTPHHSRTQSYNSTNLPQQSQQPPLQHGTSSAMDSRPSISNETARPVNGNNSRHVNGTGGLSERINGESSKQRRKSWTQPNSNPQSTEQSQDEDAGAHIKARRRPKPLLHRSKSDYGPRGDDSQTEEEIPDWGARHGFDENYASEEFVSQLANVSIRFLYVTVQCNAWTSYWFVRLISFGRPTLWNGILGEASQCRDIHSRILEISIFACSLTRGIFSNLFAPYTFSQYVFLRCFKPRLSTHLLHFP